MDKIEAMRMGGSIGRTIFDDIQTLMTDGTTTKEINDRVHNLIDQNHARPAFLNYPNPKAGGPIFPSASCISINEEVIHGIPSERELRDGDLISVDIGIEYDGYIIDSCRTYEVGLVSEEAEDLNYWTWRALQAAIGAIEPGVQWHPIAKKIQKYAVDKGYGVLRHHCGHGVGKTLHDGHQYYNYPRPGDNPTLEVGDTFCVEPMFTLGSPEVETASDRWTVLTKDRKISVHHEATILVIEGGCEVLCE